jgi:hypothetical protein
MRFISTCGLLFCLSGVGAFGQATTAAPVPPAEVSNASVDYAALKEKIAQQNKELQDKLAVQRAIVKQKQQLLKDAQKLDAANKKMEAEQKKLAAQGGDLDKQRETLKSNQGATETASAAK